MYFIALNINTMWPGSSSARDSSQSPPFHALQAESHQLGSFLRSTYMSSSSPSYIADMNTNLVDTHEVHVHAKAGGEGTVIFDSAIALLEGLFPPNPANKIVLANETTVITPLGGYQYVPIETIEPGNDKSLEPWTDCPAFEQHISNVYSSSEFKKTAQAAEPFHGAVRDYVFGRPTTLENALSHNKTYAHRLSPILVEQARGFADFHENTIFSDKVVSGIGNLAGHMILHTVLSSLQRIAFNGDPLQFLLNETSYQPFISLFHVLEMVKENPELGGIPNYASALAFELRRGPAPEDCEFIRIKFKNGTNGDFETYHALATTQHILAAVFLLGMFVLSKFVKRTRAKAQNIRIRLADDEVSQSHPPQSQYPNYGTLSNVGRGIVPF
ncbi:histidine phosphatase superfamily [Suillus subluteus]|nr:histidine phosphatase superfamily [Suillus subluteus]